MTLRILKNRTRWCFHSKSKTIWTHTADKNFDMLVKYWNLPGLCARELCRLLWNFLQLWCSALAAFDREWASAIKTKIYFKLINKMSKKYSPKMLFKILSRILKFSARCILKSMLKCWILILSLRLLDIKFYIDTARVQKSWLTSADKLVRWDVKRFLISSVASAVFILI